MLIESLARLTLLQEECKLRGITIISPEFMEETQNVIDSQVKILQNDVQFQLSVPGPYVLGVGKYSINIFPPSFTESADWVMILLNEETQHKEKLFVFHTLLGLIENLGNAFKIIKTHNDASENKSTETCNRESSHKAGSFQTDSITDIVS